MATAMTATSRAPRARPAELAATGVAALLLAPLAVFVAWPLARVLAASVTAPEGSPTLAHYGTFFGTWRLARVLLDTLLVGAVSTAVTVTLAAALAYATTRTTAPGGRLLGRVCRLGLVAPPFVMALALTVLFGRSGLVTRALDVGGVVQGFHGIVAAQVLTFLGPAYLRLAEALRAIDPALEEAAENLGAGTLTTCRRVTLALARPGLAATTLVVLLLCLGDFANPILVGGRYTVLTTAIYAAMVGANDAAAAATMSVVLVVPCLAVFLLGACRAGRRPATAAGTDGAPAAPRPTPPAFRWPLAVLVIGTALAMVALYAVIPLGAVVRPRPTDGTVVIGGHAFRAAAGVARVVANSVTLGLLAGVVGTALALVIAHVTGRRRPSGARLLGVASRLPEALPGTVLGLAYVLAFVTPPLPLTGTAWILIASVVIGTLPAAVRGAGDALAGLDPALGEAAVSLGAGRVRRLVRVVLPLSAGSAGAIFVHVFIQGLVTVSAVIFLATPAFELASVVMLAQARDGDPAVACALATIVLGLALGTAGSLRAFTRRGAAILGI